MFTLNQGRRSFDMYTVPAKVPVQAKKLIASFETGHPLTADSDDDDNVIEVGRDHAVADEPRKRRVRSEVSIEELAQPGTARKLLLEFESLSKATNSKSAQPLRVSKASSNSVDESEQHRPGVEVEVGLHAEITTSEDGVNHTTTVEVTRDVEHHSPEAHAEVHIEDGVNHSHTATVEITKDETEHSHSEAHVEVHIEHQQQADEIHEPPAQTVVDHVSEATEAIPNGHPAAAAPKTVLIVIAVEDKTPLDWKLFGVAMSKFEEDQCTLLMSDASKAIDRNAEFNIEEERQKVMKADLVIFHCQPILHCIPAALLHWLEAVFSLSDMTAVNLSPIRGKRSIILLTTPHQQTNFTTASELGDMSLYLWPIQVGILRYVGFHVLPPQVLFDVPGEKSGKTLDEADAERMKADWITRLGKIWDDSPADLHALH